MLHIICSIFWSLTVALPIFRITLALLACCFLPKVSKQNVRSIQWLIWFDQLVITYKVEKWLTVCLDIIISGPFSVKLLTKFFRSKIFIAPKNSFLNSKGSLFSYFWAIMFISTVTGIQGPLDTLVPKSSATVNNVETGKYRFWLGS